LNRSRRSLWIALALALAFALPTPAKKVSLKSWIEGPVRYLAEHKEAKVFKQLKTDGERAWFIERFWARRDPTPETLANEYRQMFWERVQYSNEIFLDSHRPGWLTDRGKIYILYGPPTKIEDHTNLDTHGGPTTGRGLLRWIYEGRPGGRMDLDPVVIVPFVRQSSGEYRVSYDPKLSSIFFDALAVEEQWDRAIDKFNEIFGAPRATEMSVMLDLGRMQEVPPQAQILLARLSSPTRPIRSRSTSIVTFTRARSVSSRSSPSTSPMSSRERRPPSLHASDRVTQPSYNACSARTAFASTLSMGITSLKEDCSSRRGRTI